MYILGIETATATCSVALRDAERVCAAVNVHRARVHGEQLPLLIQETLKHAAVDLVDLDAVAVSKGPGSYTGLRIGGSTAKGLVEATGAALVGTPSLQALAAQMAVWTGPDQLLVPCFRSRRGEVYAAVYSKVSDGWETIRSVTALPVDEAADWLPAADREQLWLAGPGAYDLTADLCADRLSSLRVLPENAAFPSGASVAGLGLSLFKKGKTDDPASFEPFYLKDFVPG